MGGPRAFALAIPVALAIVVPVSLAELGTTSCVSRLPGRSCLPAPITIEAGARLSNYYEIARDGRVRRVPTALPRYPHDASCCIAPGVWFSLRGYHMVVGRGERVLWHSHGELPRARGSFNFQVLVGSHTVAFLYGNYLYLAPFGGAQRRIGPSELPLGFTNGGLYTYLWGRKLLLRSDSGAILKAIARVPPGDYFVVHGALYFIAHGVVMRARGATVECLVSLRRLGLSKRSLSFEPSGSLLDLEDSRKLVVLRPDGSVFAWTRLREQNAVRLPVSVADAPGVSAVAFTVLTIQTHATDTVLSHGTETVYVLRPGTHKPIAFHRAKVGLGACGEGGSLEWHGSWLLYSNGVEHLAAIETTGRHRTIELGSRVKGLAGTQQGFSAYWSGRPPEPF